MPGTKPCPQGIRQLLLARASAVHAAIYYTLRADRKDLAPTA